MSFVIFTDTSANLPTDYLVQHYIQTIPLEYLIDGRAHTCLDTETFDGERYYEAIRSGTVVTTSQITPQHYIDCFTPVLAAGQELLFIGMSSGISGSYHSAEIAAAHLREQYPDARLRLVDTLAASLGEGIFVLRAVDCRDAGMSLDETADCLLANVPCMYQGVMLEDLMYLKRGGRISGAKALLGTVLGIRPLLKGNEHGQLVVCGKARGRRAGLAALAEKYAALVDHPEEKIVGIAHAGCGDDAETLAEMLRKAAAPKDILIVCYEPVTGSHVGPGTVALFFEGKAGVRLQ